MNNTYPEIGGTRGNASRTNARYNCRKGHAVKSLRFLQPQKYSCCNLPATMYLQQLYPFLTLYLVPLTGYYPFCTYPNLLHVINDLSSVYAILLVHKMYTLWRFHVAWFAKSEHLCTTVPCQASYFVIYTSHFTHRIALSDSFIKAQTNMHFGGIMVAYIGKICNR